MKPGTRKLTKRQKCARVAVITAICLTVLSVIFLLVYLFKTTSWNSGKKAYVDNKIEAPCYLSFQSDNDWGANEECVRNTYVLNKTRLNAEL